MPEKHLRKDTGKEVKLAEAFHIDSPELAAADAPELAIECHDLPPDHATYAGHLLHLNACCPPGDWVCRWSTDQGSLVINERSVGRVAEGAKVALDTSGIESEDKETTVKVSLEAYRPGEDKPIHTCQQVFCVRQPKMSDLKYNFDQKADQLSKQLSNLTQSLNDSAAVLDERLEKGVGVSLQRSTITQTPDLALWVVIRESTRALRFDNYQRFINLVLCGPGDAAGRFGNAESVFNHLRDERRLLPFNDTDAYRLLKTATEAFLLVSGGVNVWAAGSGQFNRVDFDAIQNRTDGVPLDAATLRNWWQQYLVQVNGAGDSTIPYLEMVYRKLSDQPLKNQIFRFEDPVLNSNELNLPRCEGVLRNKLTRPFMVELIWSYWQEEAMLAQTMNALTRRFQNVRNPLGERDPLAGVEIDPLRPLNNLLWGYIQDEQHRLSLVRRAYEYDHHYGFSLVGRAVPQLRPADSRSKFLEAFHQLLHTCVGFFKQDDDTTVRADGFPLLNALREVHLVLSQGAHNQFGDLPSTARQEMLLQQWLLARPEFREILPTRVMVAYPEPWMDRVDAMKSLQGWTDVSVQHFHNLAVNGEQLLLSIRYGAWNHTEATAEQAVNWARFWRSEIQSYIHAYRTVTGVDLSATTVTGRVDSAAPSVHLRRRMPRRA